MLAAQGHSYIGMMHSCLWEIFPVYFSASQSISCEELLSHVSFLMRSPIPEQCLGGFLFAGLLKHLVYQAELVVMKQDPRL